MKYLLIAVLLIVAIPVPSFSQTEQLPIPGLFIPSRVDTPLLMFVAEWLGKPYRLGGSTEKGIDCSQFNKRLARDVYKINIEGTCRRQWNQVQKVEKDSLQAGDLVFFRSYNSPSGWHCGTYIGDDLFIHASNKHEGVKISSLSELNYRLLYKGAGRYKN